MFGIINFGTFLIAGIILNLTPGTDTMYILGRSISQGKKAGILSALGISSGALVHCIFAALGLSLILAKSAMAFEVVKYTGTVYLIFLGIKMLISKSDGEFELAEGKRQISYGKIYISGIFTNVLNPKVALFFLATIYRSQLCTKLSSFSNPWINFCVYWYDLVLDSSLFCIKIICQNKTKL